MYKNIMRIRLLVLLWRRGHGSAYSKCQQPDSCQSKPKLSKNHNCDLRSCFYPQPLGRKTGLNIQIKRNVYKLNEMKLTQACVKHMTFFANENRQTSWNGLASNIFSQEHSKLKINTEFFYGQFFGFFLNVM